MQFHICLPILQESAQWNALRLSLQQQSYRNFTLYACVNQDEAWWNIPDKQAVCKDNATTLSLLRQNTDFETVVIDRSSRGQGWKGKQRGVGWARKLCMDAAAANAKDTDIIVSIDADTHYPPDYLQSLIAVFKDNNVDAHANPYYHPLGKDAVANKAILRYELYMRLYAINMLKIGNPYAFTALGSAMVITAKHYKKIGGISPKKSGEDFYFLQKVVKTGILNISHDVCVYPAARFSTRVDFGTGPAMIKGSQGEWQSYPFYPPHLFQDIAQSTACFEQLYHNKNTAFPMAAFLQEKGYGAEVWQKLKQNHPKPKAFERACHEFIDGLRILQFCKTKYTEKDDYKHLIDNIKELKHKHYPVLDIEDMSPETVFDIKTMTKLRDKLFHIEQTLRHQQKTLSI